MTISRTGYNHWNLISRVCCLVVAVVESVQTDRLQQILVARFAFRLWSASILVERRLLLVLSLRVQQLPSEAPIESGAICFVEYFSLIRLGVLCREFLRNSNRFWLFHWSDLYRRSAAITFDEFQDRRPRLIHIAIGNPLIKTQRCCRI